MIVQSGGEQSGGLSSEIKFYDIQVRVQAFEQSGTLPLGCMWYQDVLLMWILKFYEHQRQKKGEKKSQHTHTCIHMEKQHMVYYSGVKCTGGFRLSALHTAHSWATQTKTCQFNGRKKAKNNNSGKTRENHSVVTVPTFSQLCSGRYDMAGGAEKRQEKCKISEREYKTKRDTLDKKSFARWQKTERRRERARKGKNVWGEDRKEKEAIHGQCWWKRSCLRQALLPAVSIDCLSNTHWAALQDFPGPASTVRHTSLTVCCLCLCVCACGFYIWHRCVS